MGAGLEGRWHQLAGMAKQTWAKLTHDDLAEIEGRHERLVGKLQARYGYSREQAEAEVRQWVEANV